MWLSFLDNFFFVFHSLVVLFILFGWTWGKTRLAHLGLVLVTAFFWVVAGIWYGLGYCPCTDWHWTVKEKLGQRDLPNAISSNWRTPLRGWTRTRKLSIW